MYNLVQKYTCAGINKHMKGYKYMMSETKEKLALIGIINEYDWNSSRIISDCWIEHEDDHNEYFECGINNDYEMFINAENHQTIILKEIRYDGEEHLDSIIDVINRLPLAPYGYLSDVLNKESEITVLVSQVFGTTSDYIIIHGEYFTDINECEKFIEKYNDIHHYKYVDIKDKKSSKIELL